MSRCRAPATACRNGTLVLMACLLLAACAGQPVREAPPVASGAATATQEAREAALREVDAWSLEGRVALANDGRGGSGRLDWHQAGTRSTVSLSAPITRQSWRLTAGPGGATLEGMEGGSRQAPPRVGHGPAALLHPCKAAVFTVRKDRRAERRRAGPAQPGRQRPLVRYR